MNLIYADLRDARSPHGRVDDNDEGNGDGEREQRDESQPGRNVRRDVQSRMKTDMRRARKFTVGALPLVYAGYARRMRGYQRNSYYQGNVRRRGSE